MTAVSVLVPTFDRPALLAQALESLKWQTMPARDFEVVVVNDGGTDVRHVWMAAELPGQYLTVKHGGQGAALNAALAASTGRYVTVAHDDDLVLPAKLSALADALDKNPWAVASYGLPIPTDEAGKRFPTPAQITRFVVAHRRLEWAHIDRGDGLWVHGTATMYRREALEQIKGWDTVLKTAEEYDLHLRLLKDAGPFVGVAVPVVTYRAGGKSKHFRVRNRRKAAMDRIYKRLGWSGPKAAA